MWRSRWRCVIKPAYSVSFLLLINIFVWQNVLYFLDAPHNIREICEMWHRTHKRFVLSHFLNYVGKPGWNFFTVFKSYRIHHGRGKEDLVKKCITFYCLSFICLSTHSLLLTWYSDNLHFVLKFHTSLIKVEDYLCWVLPIHGYLNPTRSFPPLRWSVTETFKNFRTRWSTQLDFFS